MKKISIVIPCFNEVENVPIMSAVLLRMFDTVLSSYDYEIIFIDNGSTDGTRQVLEALCINNKKIKAIFNVRNFGWSNSSVYGLCQTTGVCTVMICADFQEPPELIPRFVEAWEQGAKIVVAIKNHSEENPVLYAIRSLYYKTLKNFSAFEQIEHFTGFGLYDKSFIDMLRDLNDPVPFLRGIVAELGGKRKEIFYTQQKRHRGRSHFDFFSMYDLAMLSFTSYTKMGLRMATLAGFVFSAIMMCLAVAYFVFKLFWWNSFQVGMAPVVIGMFFLGSVQLFFLGLLGEYVLSINTRVMHRPLVVEEKRINFDG